LGPLNAVVSSCEGVGQTQATYVSQKSSGRGIGKRGRRVMECDKTAWGWNFAPVCQPLSCPTQKDGIRSQDQDHHRQKKLVTFSYSRSLWNAIHRCHNLQRPPDDAFHVLGSTGICAWSAPRARAHEATSEFARGDGFPTDRHLKS
jgi:hypothetical protein